MNLKKIIFGWLFINLVSCLILNFGSTPIYTLAQTSPNLPQSSNLKLWLKADILNLQDNSKVDFWADSSGNNHNASQNNSDFQPTFLTNRIANKPAVSFDQNTLNTNFLPSLGNNKFTIISVIKNQNSTNQTGLWHFGRDYNLGGIEAIVSDQNLEYRSNSTDTTLTQKLTPNNWDISVLSHENSTQTIYQNGIPQATGSNTFNFGNGNFVLGNSFNGSFGRFEISEMLIYQSSLTEVERKQVECYLSKKYNQNLDSCNQNCNQQNLSSSAISCLTLDITGGSLSLFSPDSSPNNDVCSDTDIIQNKIVDTSIFSSSSAVKIGCSLEENSLNLKKLITSDSRQNTSAILQDMVIEDIRGLSNSNYIVTATISDFVDRGNPNQKIVLGSNPDNLPIGQNQDTDPKAPIGSDNGKLYAYLDPSFATVTVLRPTDAVNSGTRKYKLGKFTSVTNTSTPITVLQVEETIPARIVVNNIYFGLRIPSQIAPGNYTGRLTITVN